MSLLVLFGCAVVLAWISSQGAWASTFAQSPASPLLPESSAAGTGFVPGSSSAVTTGLLAGTLGLVALAGVPLLSHWMEPSADEPSSAELEDGNEEGT